MCTQVSRLDTLAERESAGRKDIGVANHSRRAVYGSSDTAIACRSVPFQGCEEKELKGMRKRRKNKNKKRRDIHRARASCEEESCDLPGRSDTCGPSKTRFPFRSLRTSEPSRGLYLYLRLDLNTSQMYARPKYYYVDRKPRVV